MKAKFDILEPIMFGIRYMLPCVVAGGILIGISFMLDDATLNVANFGRNTPIASFFNVSGYAVFRFMLPVLCASIAYYFSREAAIPSGIAMGYLASTGNSGFLGALIMGFVCGFIVNKLIMLFRRVPGSLAGTRDLLFIPLFSVGIASCLMVIAVEPVVGFINLKLTGMLNAMTGSASVVLGMVTAGMQSVDMGGPVNKTAYLFATGALSNGVYTVMSAVLAGGIVPPFITAFASTLFPNKFTKDERKQGLTNYIVGLAGLTECAIPFLLREPLKTIIACVTGSAIAGGLSMYLGCSIRAPFGGLFVAPLNSNFMGWVISVLAGVAVGTLILGLSKKPLLINEDGV